MKLFLNKFINILDLYEIISEYKKRKIIFYLFLLSIISSFFEIMTIGSIIPLVDIILNLKNFENYNYVFYLSNLLNIDIKNTKYLLFLLLGFFLFFSYLIKIFLIYLTSYITFDLSVSIHDKVFNKTLVQNFEYHTGVNSSILLGSLEKADLVRQSIFSLFQFFISLILTTSIFFLYYLLIIN